MFIDNKYTKTYYQIVERAQNRSLDGYTERHHIIPKSIGGPDESFNLVQLTAREHFLCHWLLTKMVKGKRKQWSMVNALGFMMWSENQNQERYRVNARLYEQLKQKHSEHKSWANSGEHNGMYGRKHTPETIAKMKEFQSNRPALDAEAREKIRQSRLGKKWTEEQKKMMGERRKGKTAGKKNPMYGRKHSPETIAKIRARALERAALKKGA